MARLHAQNQLVLHSAVGAVQDSQAETIRLFREQPDRYVLQKNVLQLLASLES